LKSDTRRSAERKARWAFVLLLAVGGAGFYVAGLHRYFEWRAIKEQVDTLRGWVDANFVVALGLFMLLYIAVTGLSLPVSTGLSLAAGALFGRWVGTAAVSVAATTGATLAFLSGRYLFRDSVERRYGRRIAPIQERIRKDGAYYLFTLRLIPIVPYFILNISMGLTPIRLRTYVWVTWLAMLPISFLFINAGTELGSIESPRDVLSWRVLVSLALVGLIPLVLRRAFRRSPPLESID